MQEGDMFIEYNPNPQKSRIGDCVIRAVSKFMNQDWEKTYIQLCLYGFMHCDLPSANSVWGAYLQDHGYEKNIVPNTCPTCYTLKDFCREHEHGTYLVAFGSHVVTCVDGNYFDTWDSGDEVPIYYWTKGE